MRMRAVRPQHLSTTGATVAERALHSPRTEVDHTPTLPPHWAHACQDSR